MDVAKVISLTGKAIAIDQEGGQRLLQEGAVIQDTETIRVAEDSDVELLMFNGTSMMLENGAEFDFAAYLEDAESGTDTSSNTIQDYEFTTHSEASNANHLKLTEVENFALGEEGNALNLEGLLEGITPASTPEELSHYLNFTSDGENTILSISKTGDGQQIDQMILFSGLALEGSDAEIIQGLLDSGNLQI